MKKEKNSNDSEENGNETNGKKKSLFRRALRWFILIPLFFLVILVCGVSAGFVIFAECSKDLPNVEKLKYYSPSETTKIFSADGELLTTLYKENREWVSIDRIPKHQLNAIVAIEDSRFYEHNGVSFKDIARAVLVDFKKKGASQGASTITQQLAREIFLHPQTSFRRKVREALLAIQIEKKFTKREILELYLNQVYFGSGAYGIQAAAKTYYNKDISKLDLAESAMIAGLLPAPSEYSPLVNPKFAKERQILVLKRMNDLQMITYKAMKNSINQKLIYAHKKKAYNDEQMKYPYFTTFALHELFQRYDNDLLYRGGLKIYTSLDTKMQREAEKAVKKGLYDANAQGLNCHQAAMVVMDPSNGYIKAMVGGNGWNSKSQFNRAWQARRQPGSSFKIFVYTTAIDSGYSPDSTVLDSPISFPDGDNYWTPKNSDGRYLGAIPMKTAVMLSRNVAAVRLLSQLGPEKVIQYAYKMGIKDKLEPHLSIALGSDVVTPLDMTSAAAVLSNGGIRVEPTSVKLIVDSEGNVIENNMFPAREAVLPATTASQMTEMLQGVVQSGTGTRAQIGRPAAGKTGTTDSFRDAWFVGFTPELACAVWTGNDDYAQMNHAFGGNIPAGIWGDFMKVALEGKPLKEFHKPKMDLIPVLVCDDSGLRANSGCPKTHKEFFRMGKEPKSFCNLHGGKYNGVSSKRDDSRKNNVPTKPEVKEDDLPPPDLSPQKHEPSESEGILEKPEKDTKPAPAQPPPPEGQVDL
jgi:penicillin-binding protein 1A